MRKTIRWNVSPRTGGGWDGTIVMESANGAVTTAVTARGASQPDALFTAATMATSLLDNPILRAALPPGSGAAIEAVKMISKYSSAGDLAKGMSKLVGPGAKRIGNAISKLKFW